MLLWSTWGLKSCGTSAFLLALALDRVTIGAGKKQRREEVERFQQHFRNQSEFLLL